MTLLGLISKFHNRKPAAIEHSKEYWNFIRMLDAKGVERKDGYNMNLFALIYPEERNEVERLIVEKYNENSEPDILVLFPYLQNYDGIALLRETYNGLEHSSHVRIDVGCLLYEATGEIQYLENLEQDIRMFNYKLEHIVSLWFLKPCREVYRVFKKLYIDCPEDDDALFRCIIGLLFNLGYIEDIDSFSFPSDLRQLINTLETAEKTERASVLENIEKNNMALDGAIFELDSRPGKWILTFENKE